MTGGAGAASGDSLVTALAFGCGFGLALWIGTGISSAQNELAAGGAVVGVDQPDHSASAADPAPTPRRPALSDPTLWRTLAHGDEVLALALDPKAPGLLWAGSEDGGVVVWDLFRGTFEQHVAPQTGGLPSNRVFDIAFDPVTGDAWVATDRGVAVFRDGRWWAWTTVEGFPATNARAIAVAPDGAVWVGTAGEGVVSRPAGATVWRHHRPEPYDERDYGPYDGPGAPSAVDLAIDHDGKVWAAHGRGAREGAIAVSVFHPDDGKWRHVHSVGPGGNPKRGPPTDQILALAVDRGGHLWAGTWARGAVEFDGTDWIRHSSSKGLCGRSVLAITAAEDAVWAACGDETNGEGIARWSGGPEWSAWPDAGGEQRVTALAVPEVAPDDEGDALVFLGIDGPASESLGILPYRTADGLELPALRTAGRLPPSNDVTAVLADAGQLWVGTRGDGLLHFDGARWRQLTETSSGGGLPGNTITDLVAVDGTLWAATTKSRYADGLWRDGGIGVLDPVSGRWLRTLRAGHGPEDLPDGDVGSLAVDDDGRVMIGFGVASGGPGAIGTTHHGEGLIVIDTRDGLWTRHSHESTAGELAGNTILGIAPGAGGQAWLATSFHHDPFLLARAGGGVSVLSGGTWRGWAGGDDGLTTFHGAGVAGGRDPWITGDIRAITLDATGRPWAGTWDAQVELLLEQWPAVDAVVNARFDDRWRSWRFPGRGWTSALEVDRWGRVWAGMTRGHETTEHNAAEIGGASRRSPGLFVNEPGAEAADFEPIEHLSGSGSVAAIAHDPTTGATWIGDENGGLAVLLAPTPSPTITPTPSMTPTGTRTTTPTRTAGSFGTATSSIEPTPTPGLGSGRIFVPIAVARR